MRTEIIQLLVRIHKYRKKYARIVLGESLPEEPQIPKPVPKNIVVEALEIREFFEEDATRTFLHTSQRFKVSKALVSQHTKIVSVLPEDFIAYMETCKDESIIRRFSGRTLLRITSIESAKERQDVINELMEEFEPTTR